MTDSYNVGYSVDALGDLREIYSYIANELLVPETAAAQLGRIRKEVRSLDFMPARYTLVEWATTSWCWPPVLPTVCRRCPAVTAWACRPSRPWKI